MWQGGVPELAAMACLDCVIWLEVQRVLLSAAIQVPAGRVPSAAVLLRSSPPAIVEGLS